MRTRIIPVEIINRVLAENDIVEIVSSYIRLTKVGTRWEALCPFHSETSPSFLVNPVLQVFKCYGCGSGGSVIRFVMSFDNLAFVPAVEKLAQRAGIQVEDQEP
jgi:DNA primase